MTTDDSAGRLNALGIVEPGELSATPLPRVLANTADLTRDAPAARTGVTWKLELPERDLDSNVISMPPAGRIEAHGGSDLDVLVHVLAGTGQVTTEIGVIPLRPRRPAVPAPTITTPVHRR